MEDGRTQAPALDALSRKLLWYGTAAGATLAVASDAGAQVLSTRFDPALIVDGTHWPANPVALDFDGDGDPELLFDDTGKLRTVGEFEQGDDALARLIGQKFGQSYYYETYLFWRPLSVGITVSSPRPRGAASEPRISWRDHHPDRRDGRDLLATRPQHEPHRFSGQCRC